eukprot:gene26019-31421_t
MGGSASTHQQVPKLVDLRKTEEEIVRFVMPLFYTKAPITPEEKAAAEKAWKMIINNHCSYFFELKAQHPEIEHKTVTEYFYDVFYNRFFDVNPSCRGLFQKSISKQGSFLIRMISLLLQEVDEAEKLQKTLSNLTHLHNKIGVKAVEYSIMGEVLLYTVKKCVGPAEYTQQVHFAFAKIYSRILDCIVPELEHKDLADQYASKRAQLQVSAHTPLFSVRGEASARAAAEAEGTRREAGGEVRQTEGVK